MVRKDVAQFCKSHAIKLEVSYLSWIMLISFEPTSCRPGRLSFGAFASRILLLQHLRESIRRNRRRFCCDTPYKRYWNRNVWRHVRSTALNRVIFRSPSHHRSNVSFQIPRFSILNFQRTRYLTWMNLMKVSPVFFFRNYMSMVWRVSWRTCYGLGPH